MRIATALCVAIVFLAAGPANAIYSVADEGRWPESWPAELEALRATSKTFVGPMIDAQHFAIPFERRKVFEAAWPHILATKTKGAPIILVQVSPKKFFMQKPGVIIHTPPEGTDRTKNPEKQLDGFGADDPVNAREQWMWTNYVELVVDGVVVDLNRIPLPANTPIVDERFKNAEAKAAQ
jgi:hypothetical protein